MTGDGAAAANCSFELPTPISPLCTETSPSSFPMTGRLFMIRLVSTVSHVVPHTTDNADDIFAWDEADLNESEAFSNSQGVCHELIL